MTVKSLYKITFILAVLLFISCDKNSTNGTKPQSIGTPNKIFVVSDEAIWDSGIKDTMSTYYGTPYPILPHIEPMYDISHFTADDVIDKSDRLKWHIIMFLVDMSDTSSQVTKMAIRQLGDKNKETYKNIEERGFSTSFTYDKWAHNQMVIYQFGRDKESINEAISSSYIGTLDKIQTFSLPKLNAQVYTQSNNREAQKSIKDRFGFNMRIPNAFKELPIEMDMKWLRFETDFFYQDIVIQELDYESPEQFSQEYLKNLTDTLGLHHISSFKDSTYMIVNDIDLPLYYHADQKEDQYIANINGIWELENDFKGGPFTMYLIKPQSGNKLYSVFCYVYAPSKEKRDYMVNLHHIVNSIKFDK